MKILETFKKNTDVHNLHTRSKYDFHKPNADFTKYQGGAYGTATKSFDNLPPTIKSIDRHLKVFKPVLKDYLS
jgi:hypothetical protein